MILCKPTNQVYNVYSSKKKKKKFIMFTVTTFVWVVFGFFIGLSFPTLLLAKNQVYIYCLLQVQLLRFSEY